MSLGSFASSTSQLVYWTKAKKVGEKACLTLTLPHSITLTDEFLIYSMKGTADIKEQLLAYMFKLCIATVRRNTITWANYLFIVFILTSYLEKQGKSQARHVPEILDVLCQCQVNVGLHRDHPGDFPDLTVTSIL